MENSFRSLIDSAQSILILLPTKPYFDQAAAGLSLYLSLRTDKNAQIASGSPMTVEFNRLIGVNKISQELGNKNLVIRFSDYQANNIERVSYDIENNEFRLTVIPKDRLAPPTQDQVNVSYSGISADLIILIGGANESHFPMLSSKELATARILHIGTKDLALNVDRGVISFARPAASTSELIASYIKDSNLKMDEDVATNLVMGIEDATNNLTDPSVGAETFEMIANLMRAGGRRGAREGARSSDYPPGAIPGPLPRPLQQQLQQAYNQPRPTNQPQQNQQRQPYRPPQQAYRPPQQSQPSQQPAQQNQSNQNDNPNDQSMAPKDWLEPKIFKGGSVE
jgi:hypothetical protein